MTPATIHIWKIGIEATEKAYALARPLLSQEERHRAGQYSTPALRCSFAFCRASVKCILARHAGASGPLDVVFTYAPHGKPAWRNISFSISHSGSMCILAISSEGPAGCDIQEMAGHVDEIGIAQYFHPEERRCLEQLPPSCLTRSFYRMWVRKEAVMKADGHGLSLGLDHVRTMPDDTWTFLEQGPSRYAEEREGCWWTPCFEDDSQYIMAVAVPKALAPAHIIWHALSGTEHLRS